MATRIYEWNYSWGKDINDEIFRNYFRYENYLFLLKDLIRAKQAKRSS